MSQDDYHHDSQNREVVLCFADFHDELKTLLVKARKEKDLQQIVNLERALAQQEEAALRHSENKGVEENNA